MDSGDYPLTTEPGDYPQCLDCGRTYPHGLDIILTRKQWTEINPEVDGVLCPSCIVNRAAKLGFSSVYAYLAKIEDYDRNDTSGSMLVALRLENADYCSETLELRHKLSQQAEITE
jgi:hypothetical protein